MVLEGRVVTKRSDQLSAFTSGRKRHALAGRPPSALAMPMWLKLLGRNRRGGGAAHGLEPQHSAPSAIAQLSCGQLSCQ